MVQQNLAKHNEVLKQAKDGYIKAVKMHLEKHLADVQAGKKVNLRVFADLEAPMDASAEYQTIISMLEMSTDEVIELTHQQFKQYVQNQWNWRANFVNQNRKYVTMSNSDVWNIEADPSDQLDGF